jgi:hypothetical protein
MRQLRNYEKEIIITAIVAFILLFTATNVNEKLGNYYLWFNGIGASLLIFAIIAFDRRVDITFQSRPGGTLKAIGWGFAGYVILLLISVLVMKFVDPTKATLGSIVVLLGATTPALATSLIMNFLILGFLVPYTETQLWGRAAELFKDIFHLRIDKNNLRAFGVIFLFFCLSITFAIFHLTAKGVTAFASLTVVFIMMFVSLIMIAIFGETRQAVFFHIIANSIAGYLLLFGA